MNKKMYYVLLALLIVGSTAANAQVTIGKNETPHNGAVLELNSASENLGLLLPRVSLSALDSFGLNTTGDGETNTTLAEGMIVYNTNADLPNGVGLYVWDGEGWSALSMDAAVNEDGSVREKIGKNYYKTFDYDGTVWMVENSKEGTPTAKLFGEDTGLEQDKNNGYYYTKAQAASACPAGWHLPTLAEAAALRTAVNDTKIGTSWWLLLSANAFAGAYWNPGTWEWNTGSIGAWWMDNSNPNMIFSDPASIYDLYYYWDEASLLSVRCVKD